MDNRFCDLHTHTYYSDGTSSPQELIEAALSAGVDAVALTDHNTTAGLPEFLAIAKEHGIEGIPGVEFSTDYGNTELHVVGLFIEPQHYEAIEQLVASMKLAKEESNRALVASLNRAGYALDYDEIRAKTVGQINRAHIASALTERGYTSSVGEAFATVLAKNGSHYTPPRRIPVLSTIDFIKSIGAVAILAHPLESLDEDELRVFLNQAVPHGLDAIETRYSTYTEQTIQKAEAIAAEYGLLQSGGSDFHGTRKPGLSVGTGKGSLRVPVEFLQQLKLRKAGH